MSIPEGSVYDVGRNFLIGIIVASSANELSKRGENPMHFRVMHGPDSIPSKYFRERLEYATVSVGRGVER
jgi:hypothetical protein